MLWQSCGAGNPVSCSKVCFQEWPNCVNDAPGTTNSTAFNFANPNLGTTTSYYVRGTAPASFSCIYLSSEPIPRLIYRVSGRSCSKRKTLSGLTAC